MSKPRDDRPTTHILNPGERGNLPSGVTGPFVRAQFEAAMLEYRLYLCYRGAATDEMYYQTAPTVAPCARATFDHMAGHEKPIPFLTLRDEQAKQLMDSLWDSGVRPTESRDRGDTIAAKDAHIRSLETTIDKLFKLLYPDLPLGKVREANPGAFAPPHTDLVPDGPSMKDPGTGAKYDHGDERARRGGDQ